MASLSSTRWTGPKIAFPGSATAIKLGQPGGAGLSPACDWSRNCVSWNDWATCRSHLGRYRGGAGLSPRLRTGPEIRVPVEQPGQLAAGPPGPVRGGGAGLSPRLRTGPEIRVPVEQPGQLAESNTWAGTRRRSRPIATPANWTRNSRPRGTAWATCCSNTWAGTRRRSRPIATPANWTRNSRARGTTWATCCRHHLGRYEEAEQAYRHACELDPKFASPWNGLGNLLKNHLGRYEEAEQAYRHACELDPKDASPWNGLGNLLMDCLGQTHGGRTGIPQGDGNRSSGRCAAA